MLQNDPVADDTGEILQFVAEFISNACHSPWLGATYHKIQKGRTKSFQRLLISKMQAFKGAVKGILLCRVSDILSLLGEI